MRPYVLKIPAGAEDSQFFGKANVVYLSPRANVRVTVKNPDNDEAFELTPGGSARLSMFSELRISHDGTGTETFTIYVGMNTEARTAQVSGNIQPVGGSDNTANPPIIKSITDPVTVQGITDPVTVQGITDPLSPQDITGAVSYGRYSASSTLNTILSPASNVNGCIVYMTLAGVYSGVVSIMAKQTAPTGPLDTGAIYLDSNWSMNRISKTTLPLLVPAGFGLYEQSNTTSYSSQAQLVYKVL